MRIARAEKATYADDGGREDGICQEGRALTQGEGLAEDGNDAEGVKEVRQYLLDGSRRLTWRWRWPRWCRSSAKGSCRALLRCSDRGCCKENKSQL